MTYIDYLNNFHRWLESNTLPGNSQLLYIKLLDVFNRAGWPEHVQVNNLRIMGMTCVSSEKAAIAARNTLIESGFITYQKGKKGFPGKYSLTEMRCLKDSISDSVSEIPCSEDSINDSVSDSVFDSVSDSINASHIKTKTKTNTKTKTVFSLQEKEREKEKNEPKDARSYFPPSREEIKAYCHAANIRIDIDRFVDYYASVGWRVGNKRMKDWKSAVRNWERRDAEFASSKNTNKSASVEQGEDTFLDIDVFKIMSNKSCKAHSKEEA